MYKTIGTWTGPADKLLIDGKFFRDTFLSSQQEHIYQSSAKGRIAATETDISIPGKVLRIGYYDTKENADESYSYIRPDDCYVGGLAGKKALFKYIANNGLSVSYETVPG